MEYESRRDADDAYHEMHNKRLGRDDILKIEVRTKIQCLAGRSNISTSGPVPLLLHLGGSTLAVMILVTVGAVVIVDLVDESGPLGADPILPHAVAEAITLPAKTTVANETMIDGTVIALEARMTETAK